MASVDFTALLPCHSAPIFGTPLVETSRGLSRDNDRRSRLVETPRSPSPSIRRGVRRIRQKRTRVIPGRNRTLDAFFQANDTVGITSILQTVSPARSLPSGNDDILHIQTTPVAAQPLEDPFTQDDHDEDRRRSTPPKQHTIHQIFCEMRDAMTKTYVRRPPGHVYVFCDKDGRGEVFKIGHTERPTRRESEHCRRCHRGDWRSTYRPTAPIQHSHRLEKIIQLELKNLRYDPKCNCLTNHTEYFSGTRAEGLESLDFWCKWLHDQQPYDESDNLKGFWADHLQVFLENMSEYFECGSRRCTQRGENAPACQTCLRAGWKKWTEPSKQEELEYACRSQLPWMTVRSSIQRVGRFGIVNEMHLIGFVNFIGAILSLWKRVSDLRLFLWMVFLRLFVPWSRPGIIVPAFCESVFTALDVCLMLLSIYHLCQQSASKGNTQTSATPKPRKASLGSPTSAGRKSRRVSSGEAPFTREAGDDARINSPGSSSSEPGSSPLYPILVL